MTYTILKILTSNKDEDDDVSTRIIAFSVSCIVVILSAIFFIKTYVNHKQEIVRTMYIEEEIIEAFCEENINHTWYVIHLLASQIKKKPYDKEYVASIFKDYLGDTDIIKFFGWTEFFWFNNDLNEYVSLSVDGTRNASASEEFVPSLSKGITYSTNGNKQVIYTTMNIASDETNQYIGTLVVEFDISTIIRKLNARKKHQYTNVAIVGVDLEIVVQSTPEMEQIGISDRTIRDPMLRSAVTKIGFEDSNKELSYLDMITGTNYFIKKIKGLPFILIINIDDREIRQNIFKSIVIKFIEISIVASCFFILSLFIYRREVWLRRKAEVASEIATRATNAKSDFLAFTAHEVRSPLGFILTGSEMMQRQLLGKIPEKYKAYIDGIYNNAQLILEFITDILDESQIIAGNFKVVNRPNDVGEIIKNSITINQSKFDKKNIYVKVFIEDHLPYLICDARRILQVINNLLNNAVQYSFENSIIKIQLTMDEDKLCLEIADNGVGMKEDELKVAFAKYGSVKTEQFNFIESYGLGLPIVKMILDAHDATIVVKTALHEGTRVRIFFPAHKLDYYKSITIDGME